MPAVPTQPNTSQEYVKTFDSTNIRTELLLISARCPNVPHNANVLFSPSCKTHSHTSAAYSSLMQDNHSNTVCNTHHQLLAGWIFQPCCFGGGSLPHWKNVVIQGVCHFPKEHRRTYEP